MKTVFKVIGVILVISVIAVVFVVSRIDVNALVKRVVEDVGTETLATKVSLGEAQVQLGDESGAALKDLKIANPQGFEQPYAFELGTIGAGIESASVMRDVIVITRVVVDDAALTFEQIAERNNLQTLSNNMDSGESGADETVAQSSDDPLIAINELRLTGMSATAYSDQLDEPFKFVMDDIVVKNIGSADAGVTSDQAAEIILDKVLDAALASAKGQVKEVIEAKVRAELDKKKDEAKEDLKQSLRDKLRGD